MAAEARTSLYALKLDNQMFDITDARMPINPFADRQARAEGLETARRRRARHAVHRDRHRPAAVRADRIGDLGLLPARRRIRRQRQGQQDALGPDRRAAKGAIVRSRRHVLNTATDRRARAARSPRQAVAAALGSPLLASALPLRVASFALQGPSATRCSC